MLQNIREKKWMAFAILVPVIITMAFFGIDSYFSSSVDTYAAKIDGPAKFGIWGGQQQEISQDQFRRRYDQLRLQQRESQGDSFDSEAFESLDNKRNVLDAMVDEALLGMAAERDGITVGEAQVAQQLKEMPEFQVNGVYSVDQYRLALAGQGQTHAQFMAAMRADLARRTIPSQIVSSAMASKAELEAFLALSQQTRDLSLLDLPTPALPAESTTDEQLKAWYDTHLSDYRSEETVVIDYVEIDGATLDAPASADEATLRGLYDTYKSRYVTAPVRVAAHILVTAAAPAAPPPAAPARERATALAAKAREPGADFAAIARESSDDLGSKAEGGNLGAIAEGDIGEEFEAALFALTQVGQVTDPVRTPAGWHVIQLRELTPGSERPFEDVRGDLEAEYVANERERVFSDLSGVLIEGVYKDPTALAPAAEAAGLKVNRSQAFTQRQGDGIAAIAQVRAAAFADAQKTERQVSDAIEIGPNHVVVLHVVDHQPEAALAFDDVRDRVLADYNADRLAKASKAQADAMLKRALAGESLDALATEAGRTVATLAATGRRANLPPRILEVAFGLSAPAEGKPSIAIAEIAPDRFALVAVTAITAGDLGTLDDATREALLEQFSQARGVVEYQDYVKALRRQYTVKVAEDRL
ncbi:MAG: SurA N-terminal domain-containing protein [Arenimonas sp.]|uniref:SurA N-terminal domain-containing protein n=1 Tax=Arenimonas sp. TaxID=1872635 RepID=UPI0025B93D93|nr:SurA N-terminal domain-containing protein [Arenimonas sp.]MBW8366337.1 SurA N-terminal domain-containing protein [Arenimonas sp.]